MSSEVQRRALCAICRRLEYAHTARLPGACDQFRPPRRAPPVRAEWRCERCKGDNETTHWHNTWEVTVCGEQGSADDPDVGEYNDDLAHDIELCDACAVLPDVALWCLSRAVRLELQARESACTEQEFAAIGASVARMIVSGTWGN